YNYIKNRFYLIDDGNCFLHIFTYTGPGLDQANGWLDSCFLYEKSVAIPYPMAEVWGDMNGDKVTVDYDPNTGEELGIIMLRKGNASTINGSITYINWPEV
ncbi:MAG TPA: hypothetical protein VMW91_11215, partial [Desulfosporosinus sp.]|nr:hypothetical protein [Desulfosporosinus sp.]